MAYFKDTTKIDADDVYELHSCKVSGGKKIDCGIRCKSAVNCGKKCHSKAIMVQGTFAFSWVSYVDSKNDIHLAASTRLDSRVQR